MSPERNTHYGYLEEYRNCLKFRPGTCCLHRQRGRYRALGDLNDNASRVVRRLRAYSASITALLPADPMTHPLLAIRPASRAAEDLQRYELRDALVAVRSLAESLDDIACGMGDDVDHAIGDLEEALGVARGVAA